MEASKTPSLSLLKVCKVKLREATDRAKRLTESVAVLRGSLILSMVLSVVCMALHEYFLNTAQIVAGNAVWCYALLIILKILIFAASFERSRKLIHLDVSICLLLYLILSTIVMLILGVYYLSYMNLRWTNMLNCQQTCQATSGECLLGTLISRSNYSDSCLEVWMSKGVDILPYDSVGSVATAELSFEVLLMHILVTQWQKAYLAKR